MSTEVAHSRQMSESGSRCGFGGTSASQSGTSSGVSSDLNISAVTESVVTRPSVNSNPPSLVYSRSVWVVSSQSANMSAL